MTTTKVCPLGPHKGTWDRLSKGTKMVKIIWPLDRRHCLLR